MVADPRGGVAQTGRDRAPGSGSFPQCTRRAPGLPGARIDRSRPTFSSTHRIARHLKPGVVIWLQGRGSSPVTSQTRLTGFKEFKLPTVRGALGDAFAASDLGDADFRGAGRREQCRFFPPSADWLRETPRMSRTSRSAGEGLAGGPSVLDLCLMSTPQVVTKSPNSSVPQAARFDPHA